MKFRLRFLLCVTLLPVGFIESSAQGIHWSYHTRVTQSYDAAPGQKAPAAPAPDSVPYPIYPWELVRAHVEGSATLQFRVTASGGVEDVSVVKATQKEFSESAIGTVKSWRFLPLAKNAPNYPPSVVVICTFKFEMPEE